MYDIELLAPAGSMESLYSAVQAGADAVYMGGSKFSARAYASNFDNEKMKEAINYCHLYKVKVYVTLNTLIKENELKEAIEYVGFLYSIGVDALIIQDTGVIHLIKTYYPNFELHASTQMTVHNGEGAKFLRGLGFERVVLSRELSLKEIEYISKDLKIETEIFIHGALCVSYSGQCLMSSILGGRSGNRGRCAQPCRLPYTLVNNNSKEEKSGYLLSPKDMCTLENIEDLIKSGAKSFKIEGRMKRPEYVAGVVRAYREAIDAAILNQKFNEKKRQHELLQLFNREGFSKAYLYKNTGKDMMAYKFPKNSGVFLGSCDNNKQVKLQQDLAVKDGVRIKDKGFMVSSIIKDGKEVEQALKGDIVKIKPSNYKTGDKLYKAGDTALLNELAYYYKNKFEKKIGLKAYIDFIIGQPIKFYCTYEDQEYIVEGDLVQKALKRPLSIEKIEENIKKSGDTPFKIEEIYFKNYEEGFLPVSSINSLRRLLIQNIQNKKVEHDVMKQINIPNIYKCSEKKLKTIPNYLFLVTNEEQIEPIVNNGFKNIMVDAFIRESSSLIEKIKLKYKDVNLYIKTPTIIKDEFLKVSQVIKDNLKYISGIVTCNLGIINKFKDEVSIIGDYKLNIFNSLSAEFYKNYLSGINLSVELNKNEIKSLVQHLNLNPQILIYGKIENMISEYCPIGSIFGGKTSKTNCNKSCAKGEFSLIDRMNASFKIKTDKFCRSHIYNSVPLNLVDNISEFESIGINSFRIDFIDENYKEVEKVVKAIKEKCWNENFNNYTRGHFKRGVE